MSHTRPRRHSRRRSKREREMVLALLFQEAPRLANAQTLFAEVDRRLAESSKED